jgi:hypothetical protein
MKDKKMAKQTRELTDKECIKLVRGDGSDMNPYLYGEGLGGNIGHRFVVALVVPYGRRDGVSTVAEALESFRELLTDDDWIERNFVVLDTKTKVIRTVRREDFK